MPIGDLLAQISGEQSPTFPTVDMTPKRKADDDLKRPPDKIKRTRSPVANSSRPMSRSQKHSAVDKSLVKMKLAPTASSPRPVVSTSKISSPAPASTEPPKPPKKGSYAEIMARGKAAQAILGQVGKIQHKPIEKAPTKREREELKARRSHKFQSSLAVKGKPGAAGQPPLRDGSNGTRENNGKVAIGSSSKKVELPKKIKKAALATTGYTGTARPKPGSTTATSKSSTRTSHSPYQRSGSKGQDFRSSSRRYVSASEEEDDEEGQEYDSDVSSDMEAAAFEVDEEEEEAARIARREDAEALREELRLKREKEEKRKRLAAMARARR